MEEYVSRFRPEQTAKYGMLAQYKQTDQDFIINRFRYKNIVSLACNL
jgi:hypothetical protein